MVGDWMAHHLQFMEILIFGVKFGYFGNFSYICNMEINEKIVELKKEEQELTKELAHWQSHTAVNNMGKWAKQTKIDNISERLKKVQQKIDFHNNLYLSNEIYKQWKDENLTN